MSSSDVPYSRAKDEDSSVVIPIMLVVVIAAISIAIYRQQVAVLRLDRTDVISCRFLNADATTRVRQATNSEEQIASERKFVNRAIELRALFIKNATNNNTLKQTQPLLDYLLAEAQNVDAAMAAQTRNVSLTRALAVKAQTLAKQLSC